MKSIRDQVLQHGAHLGFGCVSRERGCDVEHVSVQPLGTADFLIILKIEGGLEDHRQGGIGEGEMGWIGGTRAASAGYVDRAAFVGGAGLTEATSNICAIAEEQVSRTRQVDRIATIYRSAQTRLRQSFDLHAASAPGVFCRGMYAAMRLAFLLSLTVALSANGDVRPSEFKTIVEPLPDENLAGPCAFELWIPGPTKQVRAVWITYDRGFDIRRYYSDAEVRAFAQRHSIALMLASQCPAKLPPTGEKGEMDMDVSRGVARSIFAALNDFARQSGHAEISNAKLIVMGFSGIGALFGHFVRYAPDRVLAAILANPGQTEPYGMKEMNLEPRALAVPQFIITGGIDDRGGTQRPWDYFSRHRARGAPWVFLVQNGLPHCCVINVKLLLLEWLAEMVKLREPASSTPLRSISVTKGWSGFIRPCENGKRDTWGGLDWNVCDASIQPVRVPAPTDQLVGAWFPSHRLASDWLMFIREQKHPADSFPDGKDAMHSPFASPMRTAN